MHPNVHSRNIYNSQTQKQPTAHEQVNGEIVLHIYTMES